MCECVCAHLKQPVAGVSSRLNSATVTPLSATSGAYRAAGYTTEEVPTCVEVLASRGGCDGCCEFDDVGNDIWEEVLI